MKKYTLFLAALCLAVAAHAAPPSDKSIEEMMSVVQVEKMLDQMVAQMNAGMAQGLQQSLQGKTLSAAQQAKVGDFQNKVLAMLKDELSFAKMKDIYLRVYRETFTQDEINGIVAFYATPAGKAMVEKNPVVMQKAGAMMQERIGPMTEKLQSMMADFDTEMEKTK